MLWQLIKNNGSDCLHLYARHWILHDDNVVNVCVCSCGTYEQTIRGLSRRWLAIRVPCAVCTSKATALSVDRLTAPSKCGTCHLNRAGPALLARWRWSDTQTLFAASRSFCTLHFLLVDNRRPVLQLCCMPMLAFCAFVILVMINTFLSYYHKCIMVALMLRVTVSAASNRIVMLDQWMLWSH